MEIKETLSYDDVLLVPQYSDISSRSKVDLTVKLPKGIIVRNPIVPANMKTVTGLEMAKTIYYMGGMAILHRFMPFEEQLEIVNKLHSLDNYGLPEQHKAKPEYPFNYVGISIGVQEQDKINLEKFVENRGINIICIDIAHGDSKMCVDMVSWIAKKYPRCLLIAGNVATGIGARRLWEAGADIVKVGIGPGSLCTTRIETAAGVPQLSAIMEVAKVKHELKTTGLKSFEDREIAFIADGGIKSAGDIVKALCFADLVMVGNLFAGTDEAPGDTVTVGGNLYKTYVGSSTHKTTHIEGVAAMVPLKGSAKLVMARLLEGLASGCSYQGSINLTELKENPAFIRMTNSGLKESHPHDVVLK